MPRPSPDELLRRLRAIYCRHRGMTYDAYDDAVAQGRISFGELIELVEVLFTEIQHAGLADYLFREDAAERERNKNRLVEIEAGLARIGSMRLPDGSLPPGYDLIVEDLKREARTLRPS